jgi:HD-GYP domain-containing protein (c-di-GMP phosphodiesterase class II)
MVNSQLTQSDVRLAEVVASLCLATDLAMGQPLEHGLRRAILAVWLGQELGLGGEELHDAYYVALLGTVGCAIQAANVAGFCRDEIALGERLVLVDPARPLGVATFFLGSIGAGFPPLERAGKLVSFARQGTQAGQTIARDVAMRVGEMLGLGPAIADALGQCTEHWDGKFPGGPRRLKGEEISLSARLYLLAHDAEVFHRVGGVEAATAVVRERAGRAYDPRLAACFCRLGGRLLARLQAAPAWDTVLAAEPGPVRLASAREFDDLARAVANFVDLRSEHTLGHSPGVASLAEAAARGLGLSEVEAAAVRQFGLLHDLGRAGVPVAVWDKREPLTATEWDRVKRHPSLTELVLARSDALGHLGTLAGLHHERLDGSGYRGVRASFLPVAARVLAAADTYQAKLEPRPHRAALSPPAAAEEVRRRAGAGQLDPEAVAAVLAAAGRPPSPRRREWPAGLSAREVEVLRLAVRGLSNRQIGEALVVSPRTVGHHLQHIYDKIGVSTRVGATLFALHHGLVRDEA